VDESKGAAAHLPATLFAGRRKKRHGARMGQRLKLREILDAGTNAQTRPAENEHDHYRGPRTGGPMAAKTLPNNPT